MIIPCIDLMGGKVVQLVQGERKALEADSPDVMLRRFAAFPEIQVIDLDAARDEGTNDPIVRWLCQQARCRVGGGIRTVKRALELCKAGAWKLIVGTAAFSTGGPNFAFLDSLVNAVGREKIVVALDSRNGRIVVRGWKHSTNLEAERVIRQLEPYCSGFLCTYVDKEGMLQGTNLEWFERLRQLTNHELTAAGGISSLEEIRQLLSLGIHVALGMAIYTGKLDLAQLADINRTLGTSQAQA